MSEICPSRRFLQSSESFVRYSEWVLYTVNMSDYVGRTQVRMYSQHAQTETTDVGYLFMMSILFFDFFFCRFEYRWADGVQIKKPIEVSAPKYVDYLMDWIELQLNNEAVFPQKIGAEF